MQYSKKLLQCICIAAVTLAVSCGPNGDQNSVDTKNSGGEGSVDTTRMPNFDTVPQQGGASHNNSNDKDTGNVNDRR